MSSNSASIDRKHGAEAAHTVHTVDFAEIEQDVQEIFDALDQYATAQRGLDRLKAQQNRWVILFSPNRTKAQEKKALNEKKEEQKNAVTEKLAALKKGLENEEKKRFFCQYFRLKALEKFVECKQKVLELHTARAELTDQYVLSDHDPNNLNLLQLAYLTFDQTIYDETINHAIAVFLEPVKNIQDFFNKANILQQIHLREHHKTELKKADKASKTWKRWFWNNRKLFYPLLAVGAIALIALTAGGIAYAIGGIAAMNTTIGLVAGGSLIGLMPKALRDTVDNFFKKWGEQEEKPAVKTLEEQFTEEKQKFELAKLTYKNDKELEAEAHLFAGNELNELKEKFNEIKEIDEFKMEKLREAYIQLYKLEDSQKKQQKNNNQLEIKNLKWEIKAILTALREKNPLENQVRQQQSQSSNSPEQPRESPLNWFEKQIEQTTLSTPVGQTPQQKPTNPFQPPKLRRRSSTTKNRQSQNLSTLPTPRRSHSRPPQRKPSDPFNPA